MTKFYQTEQERLTILRELRTMLNIEALWSDGSLYEKDYDSDDPDEPYPDELLPMKFCFMGQLALVLNPYITYDIKNPRFDMDLVIDYPRTYEGGKDLTYRLGQAAWDLYPERLETTYQDHWIGDSSWDGEPITGPNNFDELLDMTGETPEAILVGINDGWGYEYVKNIVAKSIKNVENTKRREKRASK